MLNQRVISAIACALVATTCCAMAVAVDEPSKSEKGGRPRVDRQTLASLDTPACQAFLEISVVQPSIDACVADPKKRETLHQLSERYMKFLHQGERVSGGDLARASQTCPPTAPVNCEVALEALNGLKHRDDLLRDSSLADPPTISAPQREGTVSDFYGEKAK